MPDPNRKSVLIEDLVDRQLPPEILAQLQILNRVQFPLKPTKTSAVSTAGDTPVEEDQKKTIDDLLTHVADMEGLTKQIEDMIDLLTKNMSIPPANPAIAEAVKVLDPNGNGTITQDVFNKALANIDLAPIFTMGQDPVLAALTGDGTITAPWAECDSITRELAKTFAAAKRKDTNPDDILKDAGTTIAENYDKNKKNMILEIILMLWWNTLWPKFVVDMVMINPLRLIIANPIDGIMLFFKSVCNTRIFKTKSKECLAQHGPINKALNRLRRMLICKFPKKLYKRYKPDLSSLNPVPPLNCDQLQECPPEQSKEHNISSDDGLDKMGDVMDLMDGMCVSEDEMADGQLGDQPEGPGASPDCIAAAKKVLDAVLSDALSIKNPAVDNMNQQLQGAGL